MISYFQRIKATFKKYIGTRIDFDKKWNNQCVDAVKQMAQDLGAPITTFGNATDYINVGLGPNWTLVGDTPVIGDIGIMPKRRGLPYGHIFVVSKLEGKTLEVVEQNRDGKAYANDNPKNFGSNVAYGKYTLRGDEVFFRKKV